MSSVPKFIIDTDPGVDDALAILMAIEAHKRGNIEIVAITLVNGNTTVEHSQVNIMRVLEITGTTDQIPVHLGARHALVVEYNVEDMYYGEDGFNMVKFSNNPDLSKIREEPACQAMMRLASMHPGEIKLVALGPLTNVATCILADDVFTEKLAGIEVMGGNVTAEGNATMAAEFNFNADPEAAYVVLHRSRTPGKIRILPWETCCRVHIPWSWRQEVLGSIDTPEARLMNQLEEVLWKEKRFGEQWILCDQLAMACALDGSAISSSSTFFATVELHGHHTRGMMVLERRRYAKNSLSPPPPQHNIEVVDDVKIDTLKDFLLRAFGHGGA